jgi:hypothetical protein
VIEPTFARLGFTVMDVLARRGGGTVIVARVPPGRDGQGSGSVIELTLPV